MLLNLTTYYRPHRFFFSGRGALRSRQEAFYSHPPASRTISRKVLLRPEARADLQSGSADKTVKLWVGDAWQ